MAGTPAHLFLALRGAATPVRYTVLKQREVRAGRRALSSATGPCARVRRGRGARFASAQSLGPAQAGGDEVVEVAEVERFGNITEGPVSDRFDRHRQVEVSGDHDDHDGLVDLHDLFQGFDAVHSWHVDVQKHHVRPLPRDGGERIGPVRCGIDLIVGAQEVRGEHVEEVKLVVDNQDARAWLDHRSEPRMQLRRPATAYATADGRRHIHAGASSRGDASDSRETSSRTASSASHENGTMSPWSFIALMSCNTPSIGDRSGTTSIETVRKPDRASMRGSKEYGLSAGMA